MTTLYVDADACPVKDQIYRVAERYTVPVFVVSNSWIRVPRDPRITFLGTPPHAGQATPLSDGLSSFAPPVQPQSQRQDVTLRPLLAAPEAPCRRL